MSVSIHIEGTAESCREQMQVLLGGGGQLTISTAAAEVKAPKDTKKKAEAQQAPTIGVAPAENPPISTPSTAGVSPEFQPVAAIIPLVVKKVGKPKLLEMLKKYGDTVTRGGELSPEQYAPFVADCQAVLAA